MPGVAKFDPRKDVPDLAGRVILITGGTAGVGAATVIELARHNPAHILFTGRNAKSAEATIAGARSVAPGVQVTFVQCDLADLASVKAAAAKVLALITRLDILVCNAGIMAKPAALSKDGYEIHFATNHLGHALLTTALQPLLCRTAADQPGADVRVVMMTSIAWRLAPSDGGIVFDRLRSTQEMPVFGRWLRYGQSKLANMLWARELARRYGAQGVLAVSLHPGVVETGLVTDLGLADRLIVYLPNIGRVKTVEEGTHNLLWAIAAPRDRVKPGAFYEPVGRLSSSETKWSRDPKLGERLWDWTAEQLKPYL
ncbi:9a6ef236-f796-4809-87ca-696f79159db8 [Thermothielavioides terrestris]|uniref:Uncharacterized protein n=2 Tax=Thermothielavioides terrestris TaxID=2587410 RepID=G2R4B3_THETT|nr:uncharacterized protein THITE_2143714 [Thermothielavioides terrestris NRRL 8126]AEO66060.1 hypothetical protein THITE_2143714 [Thermothielavioides terrestris NRRL 8126]SPQ18681.1 9a6ef236-f796-4809-87ca-696f79159db8 [Thermothielavioides terrestris]